MLKKFCLELADKMCGWLSYFRTVTIAESFRTISVLSFFLLDASFCFKNIVKLEFFSSVPKFSN